MISRFARTATAVAMLVGVLAGCSSQPASAPTPTSAFASDEEAFAAAEKTYRAYVDALNARNDSAQSSPDPASFLIADALESHFETVRAFEEAKISTTGSSQIVDVHQIDVGVNGTISLEVCLDVSATSIVDATDADQTPVDRDERLLLLTEFVDLGSNLVISKSVAVDQC
ncbi:hypothetical protein ACWPKO_22075 (plasmid) [Coraliomargarita sp. W4R53]